MKTILLYFSDIHLTGNKPENEGAVIKAFCEDVKLQLTNLQYNDAYVLIGGDLVQAADDSKSYQSFYDKILSKLITINTSHKRIGYSLSILLKYFDLTFCLLNLGYVVIYL